MKAVVCTELGLPNLLKINDIEKPNVENGEVLIKVEVAGVNFPDALLVQGKYQIVLDPPFVPGNEVCGIIEEVGEGVKIAVGTKVIGLDYHLLVAFQNMSQSTKIWLYLLMMNLIH